MKPCVISQISWRCVHLKPNKWQKCGVWFCVLRCYPLFISNKLRIWVMYSVAVKWTTVLVTNTGIWLQNNNVLPAEAMTNRNTNSMCVKLPVHNNFASLIILLNCSQYAACIQVESEMDIHGYKQCHSIRRQFLCS